MPVATTVACLGFILGPARVGPRSDAIGLRRAMLAALAVGLFVLAPPLPRLGGLGGPGSPR